MASGVKAGTADVSSPPGAIGGQSSPSPSRIACPMAATASSASDPCAVTTTFWPRSTAKPMMAMMLLAFATSSPRRIRTGLVALRQRHQRRRRAGMQAGRIGHQDALGADCSPAHRGRTLGRRVAEHDVGHHVLTGPDLAGSGVRLAMTSELAMTICVSRLLAPVATWSRSKSTSTSPTATV